MGQWAWLSNVMETATKKRQNVIIFGHSPPGKYERSFQVSQGGAASHSKTSSSSSTWSQHWLQERFNHRYLEFVRKYSKIIIGQFFGHQHSDSFRIFRDEKGSPISWAMLNPSVSPFKISANGLVVESSNPAVRLYRYNTYSGEIYDYAQYYLDLAEANRKIEQKNDKEHLNLGSGAVHPINSDEARDQALLAASSLTAAGASAIGGHGSLRPPMTQFGLWRVEYNFTSLYEVNDINAVSMESIYAKLQSNQTWFDAYFRTNMVNYEAPWVCNDMCRHVQTCAINNVDYSQYAYCVDQAMAKHSDGGFASANHAEALAAPSMNKLVTLILTSMSLIFLNLKIQFESRSLLCDV